VRPALRGLAVAGGLLLVWQAVVWATGVERFILPPPLRVAETWLARSGLILGHAQVTLAEIALGLLIGAGFGALAALLMAYFRPARLWLMPALVASQAIPVFALAPILVLWLGYGMASKVAMASLIIFFPVSLAFLDGLRRAEPGWLDLARAMTAGSRRARWAELRHIRAPAALPALGSGLRVAAAVAPIGAVVGEWVGSGAGLGYLMLHANARMQTDLMFAALLTLAVIAVGLYYAVDFALRRLLPWQPDTLPSDERS
jgi:putative hydroxymethylpyrimidine transport system permease protein